MVVAGSVLAVISGLAAACSSCRRACQNKQAALLVRLQYPVEGRVDGGSAVSQPLNDRMRQGACAAKPDMKRLLIRALQELLSPGKMPP